MQTFQLRSLKGSLIKICLDAATIFAAEKHNRHDDQAESSLIDRT